MATLRVNNVGDSDGTTNPITLASAGALTATWPNSPANMPQVTSPDILKITVEPNTPREELIYVTAFTIGATSATVVRAQEGLPAAAHASVAWVHAPTALDFPGPAGPQGPPGTSAPNPMTSVGDMIVGGTSGTQTRLPIGTNGYELFVVSGTPAWQPSLVTLDATHSGTYIGTQAGVGPNTGAGSTFVGYQAGQNATSGWNNTFIGYQAGNACTTGTQNTAVGYTAAGYFVTGSNNTALGYDAGVIGGDYSGTTGVGASAQVNNANGTAVGYLAIAGTSSVAMGYQASAQVTSGVAIGNGANLGANNGVAIGLSAKTSSVGGSGVAVGNSSNAGNASVALGNGALAASVSGSSAIAIGNGATAQANNAVAIGPSASTSVANQLALGAAGSSQVLVSGFATRARVLSSSTILGTSDCVCLVTSNSTIVTLPAPATAGAGAQYLVKAAQNVAGVSIHPSASETIDGFSTYGVATGGAVQVVTDGTNWYVLNASASAAPAIYPRVIASANPTLIATTGVTNIITTTLPGTGQYRFSGYLVVSGGSTSATVTVVANDSYTQETFYFRALATGSTAPVSLYIGSVTTGGYALQPLTVRSTGGNAYISVTAGTANTLTVSGVIEQLSTG
jgi:hypothetical protein